MEILDGFVSGIMTPLYYGVTAVLLAWYWLLVHVLPQDSGWTWVLAIVGLTVTIRVLLIPLSIENVKSRRAMQALQPRIKELQQRYADDRKRLTQEQMKLWKEAGTNPFASCLPLLLQMPIFFALFRVIDLASRMGADGGAKGFMSPADAESLQEAVFAGARVGDALMTFGPTSFAESPSTRIIAVSCILIMSATQFYTQWQLLHSEPAGAVDDPYAQQQRVLLYVLPAVFAVGGLAFALGVLVHWVTWNVWSMAEQSFVIRNSPGSGTSGEMDP